MLGKLGVLVGVKQVEEVNEVNLVEEFKRGWVKSNRLKRPKKEKESKEIEGL